MRRLPFDHLVIALGTVVDLSGLPGMCEHSLPIKNVGDAFYLRNHVIGCLEKADIETNPSSRRPSAPSWWWAAASAGSRPSASSRRWSTWCCPPTATSVRTRCDSCSSMPRSGSCPRWFPTSASTPRRTGQSYAPTAQNAIRQTARCADNIVASLRGEKMKPFAFKGLGSLASIGGRSAVAQIMGLRVHGFFAWWLWRTTYRMKLPGWERRIRVALDWTLDLVFPRNLVQLNVFRSERVDRAHFETGETIIRQGEIGDRFYVIARGRVEIVREAAAGPVPITSLGPGEHFGELALLRDVMRTATVRALEPTDLVTLGRGDFAAVAKNLALLKARLEETLERRLNGAAGEKA